jgi:release factor glutamine methyltransferase
VALLRKTDRSTIKHALGRGVEMLSAQVDSARLDTELLLGLALNKPREFLLAWPETELRDAELQTFDELLQRRCNGEPIAYISGWKEFWSISLQVTPDTLIPRPDTECLVELALENLDAEQALRIADIGTGSGAIAAAIASERPNAHVIAVDISEACVEVARQNGARLDLSNFEVRHGDCFEALTDGPYDMVVSNPPYVALNDPHLVEGDVAAEPRVALVGGEDGLDVIRTIAAQATQQLVPDGMLIIEHGYDQGAAVRSLLSEAGLSAATTHQDLAGQDRVTSAFCLVTHA